MPINRKTLDNMLKPSGKILKLNSRYSAVKAKRVLDNLDTLKPILVDGGGTKVDGLKKFLAWQVKYGKTEGVEVKYRCSAESFYGRVYPITSSSGYVGITRSVRHYLAYDTYTDVDIDNCHPVMIEQMFPIVTGKPSVALNWWNTNRDDIFKEIMTENPSLTRDDCKSIAYTFLYGGDMKHRFKELNLIPNIAANSLYMRCKALCGEMSDFSVCLSNMYPDAWEDIGSSKDSSKLSILIQHLERHIALIMVDCAFKLNLEVGDVCHDGLLLSYNGVPLDQEQIDAYVDYTIKEIASLTGFNLALSVKTMREPEWVATLPELKEPKDKCDYVVEDDQEAVDLFAERYAGRLVYCVNWYIRPLGSYFWIEGEGAVRREIGRMKIGKHKGRGEVIPYSSNNSGCRSIFSTLCDRLIDFTDEGFIDRLNKANMGLFHFADKHYNMRTKKWVVNDPTSATSAILYINEPAPNFDDLSDAHPIFNAIKHKIFAMLDGLQFDDLMTVLSRAIGGFITDKTWNMIESNRDGGKSTICSLVSLAFMDYVATGVSPPFIRRHTGDASANRWILSHKLYLARVAWCNEKASTVDSNGKTVSLALDGEALKRFASGGHDKVEVRAHFGDETKVVINSTFFLNMNGKVDIQPKDALKTCVPFSIVREFTDDPDKLAIGGVYLPKNEEVTKLIHDPEYLRVFRWMVLDYYFKNERLTTHNLKSVKEEAEELRAGAVGMEQVAFNKHIIIDANAVADSDLVLERFVSEGVDWSKTKLTRWLKQMVPGLENAMTTIDGLNKRRYKGMFLRPLEVEVQPSILSC